MPTYEYECSKCHHHFDAFQTMSSDVYKTCPKELCQAKSWGKGKVKRLIGAGAGLLFKGSGFYITDYRSEGYKSSAKNDTGSNSPSSSGASKKGGESKTTSSTGEAKPAPSSKSSPEKKSAPSKNGGSTKSS